MKFGFDLDGTLDRPAMAKLCQGLLAAGHEVHILTGIFDESPAWQGEDFKWRKLDRLKIPTLMYRGPGPVAPPSGVASVHFLHAMPETYPRDYRLADLGLRKGAICEELGIEIFFDDSLLYCEMAPKMAGDLTVCHVR